MIANISHQSSFAIGLGTRALINVGLAQTKNCGVVALVYDLFTAINDGLYKKDRKAHSINL